jgi:AraC-like DNA-binding protein
MLVRTFTPSPKLARYVKCYYYLENNDDIIVEDTYFADGCIEAVFSVGWDFYKDGMKENWAKVIGQILKPRTLKIVGKGQSFGIWFYPHSFSSFLKVPVHELTDRVIPWDDLFPGSFARIVGDLLSDNRIEELPEVADAFLLRVLAWHEEKTIHKLTEAAVSYLYEHQGTQDLNELASKLNVSQRYLQKAFLTNVGFSQAKFLRILRFQKALQRLSRGEVSNLTTLAHESDFFDQSHFIREFKAFTGMIPSAFSAEKLPINRLFVTAD